MDYIDDIKHKLIEESIYKTLEESVSSNPDSIYVEDLDYIVLKGAYLSEINNFNNLYNVNELDASVDKYSNDIFKAKRCSESVNIIEDYVENTDQRIDNIIINESDSVSFDDNVDTNVSSSVLVEESILDNENNIVMEDINVENDNKGDGYDEDNSEKSVDDTNETDNFFNCFNIENSVNNAIACSTNSNDKNGENEDNNIINSSYVFENEPSINETDKELCPFDKYDINLYDADKIKHKNQKNLSRLGVVTLSAMIMIGSAYITKYAN